MENDELLKAAWEYALTVVYELFGDDVELN